jgi:hypothetical protein
LTASRKWDKVSVAGEVYNDRTEGDRDGELGGELELCNAGIKLMLGSLQKKKNLLIQKAADQTEKDGR